MSFLRLGSTEEDQAIADAVDRFAQETLAPVAQAMDEEAFSATRHVPGLAQLGVMGMNLPEYLGGPGVTPTAMLMSLVAISRACAATSSMIGAHYLGTDALLIGGSAEQHQQWLPRCASGEWLAAFALTEPRGGSHPADMRTRAVLDGDEYVLTGVKHFISNAAEASFMIVFAKTDMNAGARGVSAFIVPRNLAGIQISSPEKLMGIRGGHAFEVSLEGVRVPAANRLGAEGSGFKIAMQVLDNSRLDVAATSLGIAEAALKAAAEWANQRLVGGEPLATKQAIQFKLADMKLR
ncbi:MAG: acyl-CoA dehydrogenase family protein, partial [Comamonas sp.]